MHDIIRGWQLQAWACAWQVVRVLLEHGAVDGLPDLRGRTPADLARSNGHAAVAKVLNEGATLKVRTFLVLWLVELSSPLMPLSPRK